MPHPIRRPKLHVPRGADRGLGPGMDGRGAASLGHTAAPLGWAGRAGPGRRGPGASAAATSSFLSRVALRTRLRRSGPAPGGRARGPKRGYWDGAERPTLRDRQARPRPNLVLPGLSLRRSSGPTARRCATRPRHSVAPFGRAGPYASSRSTSSRVAGSRTAAATSLTFGTNEAWSDVCAARTCSS